VQAAGGSGFPHRGSLAACGSGEVDLAWASFLRLANALSVLYPTWSEEKRLLDAMLLVMPR